MKVVIEIDDNYKTFILNLLSNLDKKIIKKVEVKNNLETFHNLLQKSDNKTKLTYSIATDTSEMIK